MDKCTCKITPGTSAYGGNQIDSRGCEKHDTRDEIIEQLRQERDNALRYTELLIAERDAATKKAEQLLLSRYFTRCREGAFDHSTDCATWGDDGQGNVDGKPVHPPCNCGASWNWAKQMEAERDTAQAAEARAVEALKRCHEGAARQLAEPRDHDDDQYALAAIATDCEAVLADSAIALDWIAQQRREAAAEALEGIGAKQTSASGPAAQKVETLIFLADTADKLARLDCELIDRAAMAQRAALFRECAAMMRERGESGWTAQFEREYKGKTLAVVEAGPIGWYWYVDGSADYDAEIAPTLEAAQAAAVAWVDEQEGK